MNKVLFTLLLSFFISNVNGQKVERLAFKWKKPEAFVEIPEEFKNEDAVAIYIRSGIKDEYDVTQTINYSTVFYERKRIRILTERGLKEYTNISIRKKANYTTTVLDMRVIKKDGRTIPISSDDIKLLKTYDEEQDEHYYEYRIAVRGVEVGDEIESLYSAYRHGLTRAADIYLHRNIASLETRFDLSLKKGFLAEVYNINKMPDPVLMDDDYGKVLTWTLKNVPSTKYQNYAIFDLEFPYIQFKLTKLVLHQFGVNSDMSIESWSELYSNMAKNDIDRKDRTKGLEEYFNSFKSVLDTMNSVNKVQFFVDKINKEFTIMDNDDEDNQYKPIMYFVNNKNIDGENLRLFYRYMLFYAHIPYETGFGKQRYAGELFTEIVSSHQITHMFLSFMDEMNRKHCLFLPYYDFKFNVDERPYQIEGTQVIYIKKEDPFSDVKPTYKFEVMPGLPAAGNVRSITNKLTVDPDWTSTTGSMRVTYSGIPSLLYRNDWTKILTDYKKDTWVNWLEKKDDKEFELDTVFVEQQISSNPFTFSGIIKSKQAEVISTAGENISSLKIQSLLDHNVIPTYSFKRTADLYTPYLFTDEVNYFISFPSAVSIINEKDFEKNVMNEAGVFSLSITKITDTVFKISSVYKIKSSKIEKANYKMLVDLNDMVLQTKELNILYKKL